MARNERTSPRVAKLAARILALKPYFEVFPVSHKTGRGMDLWVINWSDLRALAGSCLTQAPDKPKAKKRKAVKKKRSR